MSKWEKLKEHDFKAGFRTLTKKTFQLPDGKIVDFDIKKEGLAVCILALTKINEVILAKQFRPGPEKILLEMPGGGVKKNEKPMQAAKRELLEETGDTGDFQFAGTTLDCAYSTMIRYNFVATNCKKTHNQQLEENELVEVTEMSLENFRAHLKSGELSDVESGYLCLDYSKMI